jgi:Membrane proteins related to metalloendopeptidases
MEVFILDKKSKFQKLKSLLRKESFYVVLFVCLCVIASAAAISIRKAKENTNPPVADNSQDLPININNSGGTNKIDNAEQVKNTQDTKSQTNKGTTGKTQNVSSTSSVQFVKPLDGTLLRKFTYGVSLVKVDTNKYDSIKGIDIAGKVGSTVVAAADGVVDEVGSEDGDLSGWYVVIKHSNGLKSKYANLDSDIKVKKNDKVTQGSVIGKVGDTAKKLTNKEEGDHLQFQIIDSKGEQVDPLKYITLKS